VREEEEEEEKRISKQADESSPLIADAIARSINWHLIKDDIRFIIF
jgi:hypothetical protein